MAVTNATYANIPFMPYLPMMTTNFGGDLQVTQVEPFRPNRISLFYNEVAQQSWGMPGLTSGWYDTRPVQLPQQQVDGLANMFLNGFGATA